MRRVVVTGFGIVSSIGNNKEEVLDSLHKGKDGFEYCPELKDLGFRSQVMGTIKLDLDEALSRREKRFLGGGAAYTIIAMKEAIEHAGLTPEQVSNEQTGVVIGSGGPSTESLLYATDTLRETKLTKRIGPFQVPKVMSSTCSATAAVHFKIKGINYSITSACSTSAHCIGNAMELIQSGKQDVIFAGGGEELHWSLSSSFDAMGAMSSKYNEAPSTASRAYDENRDGFVISAGGGILVLEELEHAKARGAKIYGEVTGYGANSDGHDMVAPSGEGAVRCMKMALKQLPEGTKIDYINTHGTSTPVGDSKEMEAIREVFGSDVPAISSTKSLTGHALGAAGVNEAIYSLLMMNNDFMAESAHIETLDPSFEGLPILRERRDGAFDTVLSNSFGFGGTNAVLIFSRYKD